jgi:orotidine-5'-phosphate decarboxylase
MKLVETLSPWVDLFKIGPILYLKTGPDLVKKITQMGKSVFLDLKFHDIPATVKRAVESAQELGVFSLTVHSLGGPEMISQAAGVFPRPKIWAVTVLTSETVSNDLVTERAVIAKESGADGVIASALEIEKIKKVCGPAFNVITPGIRAANDPKNDQKRTASARDAIRMGADYIVVGRPIIDAKIPSEAAKSISEEIYGTK